MSRYTNCRKKNSTYLAVNRKWIHKTVSWHAMARGVTKICFVCPSPTRTLFPIDAYIMAHLAENFEMQAITTIGVLTYIGGVIRYALFSSIVVFFAATITLVPCHLLLTSLTLIAAWISDCIHYKSVGRNCLSIPKFNCAIKFGHGLSNSIHTLFGIRLLMHGGIKVTQCC